MSLTLVSLQGHHKLSMHAKNEVSISYSIKVIANVKVNNRQTNKQTGQNNMPPIIQSGDISFHRF